MFFSDVFRKIKSAFIPLIVMFVVLPFITGAKDISRDEMFEKHKALESGSGLCARFFKYSPERGKMFIEKRGKVVAEVENIQPVSWHPERDVLLVREYGSNTEQKYFILYIERGEYEKKGENRDHLFGNRYCNRFRWSKDGGEVTVYSTMDEKSPEYSIKIEPLPEKEIK